MRDIRAGGGLSGEGGVGRQFVGQEKIGRGPEPLGLFSRAEGDDQRALGPGLGEPLGVFAFGAGEAAVNQDIGPG